MLIGFPPIKQEALDFHQLSKSQLIVLADHCMRKNGWSVEILSQKGIAARTAPTVKSSGERIIINFDGNSTTITSYSLGKNFIDRGSNENNIAVFKDCLQDERRYVDLEALNLSYLNLSNYIIEDAHPLLKIPESSSNHLKKVFKHVLPEKVFSVTFLIIGINIAVYLAMLFAGIDFLAPDVQKLIGWGANIRTHTLDGEWWRLITCTFLHYGILHIAMNMWVLSDIGLFVEKIIGKLQFTGAYLLSGIAGSISSLWWHEQVVGVGASGAIFGLFGVFLAINATGHIDRIFKQKMQQSILFFILFSLGIGWIVPQFDNAGHIGGLIGGIITGLFMLPSLLHRGPALLRNYPIIFAAFILIPATVLVLSFTSNWPIYYDRAVATFSENEERAMEYYNFSPETAPEAKIAFLRNTGIPSWEDNLILAEETIQLYGLPPEYIKRARLLAEYATLRKTLFEKLALQENKQSKKVNDEITSLNRDIRDVLIKMSPDDPTYLLERAEEKMKQGDYIGALEDADLLVRLLPSRAGIFDFRARIFRNLQRYEAAIGDYDKIIKMGAASADTYIDKGFCFSNLGKHNEAIDAYKQALKLSPENALAFNYRGWSYFQLNDNARAQADYRQALKIFPDLSATLSNLGLLKYFNGEYDSANYFLNKAIALDNTLDFPHQVLGRFENRKGNDAAALVHYNDAIASDPLNANNYYLRAITLLSLGKYEALDDIERALKLNPHDADYYRVLADIQTQLFGLDEAALENYSKSIALQPKNKFQYVYRSNFYLEQKNYNLALADYQKVLALDSTYASAWGNSGWIKYLQEDYEACITYSAKAIAMDSTSFYAMYNLALAELNLGNIERAKSLYITYRQKDLANDGMVNSGATSDLKDMIADNKMVEAANMILQEVFKEEQVLP